MSSSTLNEKQVLVWTRYCELLYGNEEQEEEQPLEVGGRSPLSFFWTNEMFVHRFNQDVAALRPQIDGKIEQCIKREKERHQDTRLALLFVKWTEWFDRITFLWRETLTNYSLKEETKKVVGEAFMQSVELKFQVLTEVVSRFLVRLRVEIESPESLFSIPLSEEDLQMFQEDWSAAVAAEFSCSAKKIGLEKQPLDDICSLQFS